MSGINVRVDDSGFMHGHEVVIVEIQLTNGGKYSAAMVFSNDELKRTGAEMAHTIREKLALALEHIDRYAEVSATLRDKE